jgi:hypothetical protein
MFGCQEALHKARTLLTGLRNWLPTLSQAELSTDAPAAHIAGCAKQIESLQQEISKRVALMTEMAKALESRSGSAKIEEVSAQLHALTISLSRIKKATEFYQNMSKKIDINCSEAMAYIEKRASERRKLE